MVIDPVCGMEVDPNTAAATSLYDGKTYYFCSEECKRDFDANPDQFTASAEESTVQGYGAPVAVK